MDPVPAAARQMDTDEIVAVDELRDYLEALVEMCYQSIGYRRVKNPRIWSMHDLRGPDRLFGHPLAKEGDNAMPTYNLVAKVDTEELGQGDDPPGALARGGGRRRRARKGRLPQPARRPS